MIVIKLQGGLGNQMFQYALASILAKKNKTSIKLDLNFFANKNKIEGFTPREFELSIFENKYKVASQREIIRFFEISKIDLFLKRRGFQYPKVFIEKKLGYHEEVLNIKQPVYLEGYFQSYHYFMGFENLIRKLFLFPLNTVGTDNIQLLNTVQLHETIAVHIRRGDYVNDKKTQAFHGSCSMDYYSKAISYFKKTIEKPRFVFFSDDINWVRENFQANHSNAIFVDVNEGHDSWKDMLLMSTCKHQVIANSSFSWWSAWLNNNNNKVVIAPKIWFADSEINRCSNDLIPPTWIRF